IMDHPAHHLDPTLPLYVLPESQRELEQQAEPHAVVIRWTLWDYFHACRACKLYDFDRDCWTDFDGTPTTPLGLSRLHAPGGLRCAVREPQASPSSAS